jgi:carboxyl-terminal processing protease
VQAGSLTHEMAMFYRVNGDSNQERGIPADIVLPSFTEVMEVGEKYSENHLPWRRISPVAFKLGNGADYTPVDASFITVLNARSQQRVKHYEEWKRMQKDVARFKLIRERKDASLNEKKRLKEYYDEKSATEQLEKIMEPDDRKKKKSEKDILLNETLNIAAELQTLVQTER